MKGHPIKTARTFLVSASDFNNFRSINFSFSTTDLHLIYDENKRERDVVFGDRYNSTRRDSPVGQRVDTLPRQWWVTGDCLCLAT